MEKKLEEIIEILIQNGAIIDSDSLKKIKQEVLNEIRKDQSMEEILKNFTLELQMHSEEFIYQTNEVISGLASAIYLPNPRGTYSLTVFGGKTTYDKDAKPVSEKTIFDIASITKLYTFLLTLELMDKGYLKKDDKISQLDSRFEALKDYTVEDVLKMAGNLKTEGRVAASTSYEQAMSLLKTTYVEDDLSENNYTDLGFIVLSKVIEKIVSEKLQTNMTFEDVMTKFLFKPWHLEETMFHPDIESFDVSGNGNKEGLVHDPKARILGGAVGSAGIFATSKGIQLLAQKLFSVKYVNYSKLAGTILFPTSKQSHKGYAGIYQKHPMGLDKTFVPNEYGTGSFAHQGFTGSVAVFDYKNQMHNHILVNSIKEKEPKKPDGYIDAITIYQMMLTKISLKTYLINRFFTVIENNENIELKRNTK